MSNRVNVESASSFNPACTALATSQNVGHGTALKSLWDDGYLVDWERLLMPASGLHAPHGGDEHLCVGRGFGRIPPDPGPEIRSSYEQREPGPTRSSTRIPKGQPMSFGMNAVAIIRQAVAAQAAVWSQRDGDPNRWQLTWSAVDCCTRCAPICSGKKQSIALYFKSQMAFYGIYLRDMTDDRNVDWVVMRLTEDGRRRGCIFQPDEIRLKRA